MIRSDAESKLGLRRPPMEGERRLRLTVSYCGTPWRGWQSLAGGDTVQDELNAAFLKAVRATVQVQGSGRTDAGVHALAQTAHVDVPVTLRMSDESWEKALNACLPPTIRILRVEAAEPNFHARFDAERKIYLYRIWRPRLMSAFEAERSWQVYGPLDIAAMRQCLEKLVGEHNFVRLSANRGDMPETQRRATPAKTTRTIFRAEMREAEELIEMEFEGDGFLYKMVRMIVGSLVSVGRGRSTVAWFNDLLESAEGRQSTLMAPAGGLYLKRVIYPGERVD